VEHHGYYVTRDEVKVIVNDIVSHKFDELYAAVNKVRGAIWAIGGILTLIEIYSALHKVASK
jgi:hypothetical protein